jgi:hypothetical protein
MHCAVGPKFDLVGDSDAVAKPPGAAIDCRRDRLNAERLARMDGDRKLLGAGVLERRPMKLGRVASFGASDIETNYSGMAISNRQLRDG